MRRQTVGASIVLVLAVAAAHGSGVPPKRSDDENAISKMEEEYRVAKLKNDTETLGRIVAEEYYGINQNGVPRDKAQLLELFKVFNIKSLEVEIARVRISGDNAVVAGRQREVVGCRTADCPPEIALFLRTYVRRESGWQLLTNAHFVDPTNGGPATNVYPHDSW